MIDKPSVSFIGEIMCNKNSIEYCAGEAHLFLTICLVNCV